VATGREQEDSCSGVQQRTAGSVPEQRSMAVLHSRNHITGMFSGVKAKVFDANLPNKQKKSAICKQNISMTEVT
jgi:hypothetical protein